MGRTPVSLRCLTQLGRDKTGAAAVIVGLASSVLIGFASLGTEVGLWYLTHRNLQNAADSSALSAVAALYNHGTGDYKSEAKATASRYGFTDAVNGVTVTVNKPPLSGNFKGDKDSNAVEVVISEPQLRLFSALFLDTDPTQRVRAVAKPGTNGNGCVVALNRGAVVDLDTSGTNSDASGAFDATGGAEVSAEPAFVAGGIASSASLTTTNGTFTGTAPINDPYAKGPVPYASPGSPYTGQTTETRGGGVPAAVSGSDGAGTVYVSCGGWNPASDVSLSDVAAIGAMLVE